jgi:undecaprenyl-diphosphatase
VILTPPIVARELKRLLEARHSAIAESGGTWHLLVPSLLGLFLSFVAGLAALTWLSRWLERGRWHFFGYYCLGAAGAVLALHLLGF